MEDRIERLKRMLRADPENDKVRSQLNALMERIESHPRYSGIEGADKVEWMIEDKASTRDYLVYTWKSQEGSNEKLITWMKHKNSGQVFWDMSTCEVPASEEPRN